MNIWTGASDALSKKNVNITRLRNTFEHTLIHKTVDKWQWHRRCETKSDTFLLIHYFNIGFEGHNSITFFYSNFFSALAAIPLIRGWAMVCKGRHVVGFMPWQQSFTISNSSLKRWYKVQYDSHILGGECTALMPRGQIQIIYFKCDNISRVSLDKTVKLKNKKKSNAMGKGNDTAIA